MLLRFFKVEIAFIEMIMFFGFPFSCPPLHLTPVWLNSPFSIITKKLSKIFSNTERRKLCSVRNGSSISTAVIERGEGTVFAVREYLFRCTSFPFYDCIPKTTEKETGFSVSKQSQAPEWGFFFFLLLQRFSSLFFLLLVYGLAFPHFFTAQQVTNAAGFGVRIG